MGFTMYFFSNLRMGLHSLSKEGLKSNKYSFIICWNLKNPCNYISHVFLPKIMSSVKLYLSPYASLEVSEKKMDNMVKRAFQGKATKRFKTIQDLFISVLRLESFSCLQLKNVDHAKINKLQCYITYVKICLKGLFI